MKLGPVPKLDKRNKMSKKIEDNVLSANYDLIIIFPINGWFGANRNPDNGHMVYSFYIFINNVFSRISNEYEEIGSIQSECGKMWTRRTPNTDTFT